MSTLTADITDDTITVADADGGVWHPSEQAASEILAADDPEQAAIDMCESAPMRGTWSC